MTTYLETVQDLSEASTRKNFDPYLDIAWDSPELAVTPGDDRWVLNASFDPIGAHEWYQRQPLEKQIEIGLWRQSNVAKVGSQFESLLIRGLEQYAMSLPNESVEFRYATHEAREECNHTLMFQEMVNRIKEGTGVDAPGMRKLYRRLAFIAPLASTIFPTSFFLTVLSGEEPIDHFQKSLLRDDATTHPVMEAVMQIHVAEEARHIGFAHAFVKESLKDAGYLRRFVNSLYLPLAMRLTMNAIMVPPPEFWEEFDIPRYVKREMFWKSEVSKRAKVDALSDVRMLARESGLLNPVSKLLWRVLGIGGRESRFRSEPTYLAH